MQAARENGVPVATLILGWDTTVTYGLPDARVDFVGTWSETQKRELTRGGDIPAQRIEVIGAPAYDLFAQRKQAISRADFLSAFNLDPDRKLIVYACTLMTHTPNLQNIRPLAEAVSTDQLGVKAQLLIRTHPSSYQKGFEFQLAEVEEYRRMVDRMPNVRLMEAPSVSTYSRRDTGPQDRALTSALLGYCDVFVSIFSTMMLEAAIYDRPLVSACIDAPMNWPGREPWPPLSKLLDWPTHERLALSGAVTIARTREALLQAVAGGLTTPYRNAAARRALVRAECGFADGQSRVRAANWILSILDRRPVSRGGEPRP